MAPEGMAHIEQIGRAEGERTGVKQTPPARKGRGPARAHRAGRLPPVEDDRKPMSTLSFQDFVRERMPLPATKR